MEYGRFNGRGTTREVMAGHSIETVYNGRISSHMDPPHAHITTEDEPDPKDKVSWSLRVRYVLCLLVVIAAIGGAIALAYIFKRKDGDSSRDGTGDFGGLREDDIVEEECPGVLAPIGKEIYIKCKFSQPVWNDIDKTRIILTNAANFPQNAFKCGVTETNVTCHGPKAGCSHQGDIRIRFDTGREIRTTITVTGGHVDSTEFIQNVDSVDDTFTLTCRSRQTCINPQMVFSANGTSDIIGKPLGNCNSAFSDSTGYTSYCDAIVKADVIKTYGAHSPKCEIKDTKGNVMSSRKFSLPKCTDKFSAECINDIGFCEASFDVTNCDTVCNMLTTCQSSSVCPKTCNPSWCLDGPLGTPNASLVSDMDGLKKKLCTGGK